MIPDPDQLTPDEVIRTRAILSDIEAGRRFTCFMWKAAAIIGGIAGGTAMLFGQIANDWHLWRVGP